MLWDGVMTGGRATNGKGNGIDRKLSLPKSPTMSGTAGQPGYGLEHLCRLNPINAPPAQVYRENWRATPTASH